MILGDPEPEAKVVSKYLRVAHPRYKQLIMSIETLLDISELTVEEVIGWLTAATDDEPAPAHVISKLNLMEEELSARVVSWLQLGVDTSASGSGQRRGRGHGRGKGRDRGRPPKNDTNDGCKYWGKKGHWSRIFFILNPF